MSPATSLAVLLEELCASPGEIGAVISVSALLAQVADRTGVLGTYRANRARAIHDDAIRRAPSPIDIPGVTVSRDGRVLVGGVDRTPRLRGTAYVALGANKAASSDGAACAACGHPVPIGGGVSLRRVYPYSTAPHVAHQHCMSPCGVAYGDFLLDRPQEAARRPTTASA